MSKQRAVSPVAILINMTFSNYVWYYKRELKFWHRCIISKMQHFSLLQYFDLLKVSMDALQMQSIKILSKLLKVRTIYGVVLSALTKSAGHN